MIKAPMWLAAFAVALTVHQQPATAAQTTRDKLSSVRYLVGTWNCAHTVGTFSGTYRTSYEMILDNQWLKQTYDFPTLRSSEKIARPVHAEYLMGYDERKGGWVRFGAMSNGQYFAIRMTGTGTRLSWKYVSFFKRRKPETQGPDAVLTKKSDTTYTVDGPSYAQNGTPVTEHHICKKV